MNSDSSEPTIGKLERTLSQRIQALYRSVLGHQTSQALCNLLDKKLIVVIENAITLPEVLLAESGQQDLASQVRSQLESVLEVQLKSLIEEVLGVTVTDLLSDSTLETGRTATIAILASAPKIRESKLKSKT